MEYKPGDKFRHKGREYLIYSNYGSYTVIDLKTGRSLNHRFDGTEEKVIATYTVDNTIPLSDLKIGEKFKYNSYTYVKIDPIDVYEADRNVYTAKCIAVDRNYLDNDIGRGFCIPLSKSVERVKD